MSIVTAEQLIKGEDCSPPTVTTPTTRGMLTRQATLTTTTPGTECGCPRLRSALDQTGPARFTAGVSGAITQGILTRSAASNGEQENNAALHTQESPEEIAEAEEGHFYDELFDSMMKRRLGVMWKPQVKAWIINGTENTYKLTEAIIRKEYKSRQPQSLTIHYPKERIVKAIPFRDRVWQGYLNDKYIYPIMTRSFVWGNMASQTGKGTDAARDLLKKYLWKYYTHHGAEGYVLQIDIHSYYTTIPKDKALALFKKKLPPNLYRHVEEILGVQYSESFFAGSQLVQILGIAYLDELDHYIKEVLRIRYYIRYQDDFILIHHSREVLQNALGAIENRLRELSLTLNHKKTHIHTLDAPVPFLGFLYNLEKRGNIYMRVNPKRLKEIRRRLRRYPPSFPSYVGFLEKGDSQKIIKRLEEELQRDAENRQTGSQAAAGAEQARS